MVTRAPWAVAINTNYSTVTFDNWLLSSAAWRLSLTLELSSTDNYNEFNIFVAGLRGTFPISATFMQFTQNGDAPGTVFANILNKFITMLLQPHRTSYDITITWNPETQEQTTVINGVAQDPTFVGCVDSPIQKLSISGTSSDTATTAMRITALTIEQL